MAASMGVERSLGIKRAAQDGETKHERTNEGITESAISILVEI
jgi:hypothetical protein